MFRRLLLLLLIALLPLQGIAASFVTACEGVPAGVALLSPPSSGHDLTQAGGDMPCHAHGDESGFSGSAPDHGCCHNLALAIPLTLSLFGAVLTGERIHPAIAAAFTDHLPDRLQRPPLAIAI